MVCPDCSKGDVRPGEPRGTIREDFQGAYVAPGPAENSKRAVLLLTEAFGLPLINCKLMTDEFSRRLECDVWVTDYFNGTIYLLYCDRL